MRLARAVCNRYGLDLMTGANVSALSVIVGGVALTKMLACSSRLEEAHVKPFESGNSSPFRIGSKFAQYAGEKQTTAQTPTMTQK